MKLLAHKLVLLAVGASLLAGCTVCVGRCRFTSPPQSIAEKAGAVAGGALADLLSGWIKKK